MKLMDVLLGAGIVTILEPTVDGVLDQAIPLQVAGFDMKDVVKVAGGLWLTRRRGGMMKYSGMALAVIGARNLVRSFVGAKLGASTGNNGGW